MSAVLQSFWDLASLDVKERRKAAEILLSTLYDQEITHLTALDENLRASFGISQDGIPSALAKEMSADDVDVLCSTDVAYSLRRLFKGLVSSRQGARQGFSTALCELISHVIPFVSPCVLVDTLKSHTEMSTGLKGYEERDLMFGRVFGYAAIVRSGVLANASPSNYAAVMEDVAKIAYSKPYLREICFDMIRSLLASSLSTWPEISSEAVKHLFKDSEVLPEHLAVVQLLFGSSSASQMAEIMQKSEFKNFTNIYAPENIPKVSVLIRESHEFAHPRINECVIPFAKDMCDTQPETYIQEFWNDCVEEQLINGTLEKKFLALKLFKFILPLLIANGHSPVVICSSRFVKCLLNSLDTPSLSLHKVAKIIGDELVAAAENDKNLALQLVAALTGTGGAQKAEVQLIALKVNSGKQLVEKLISICQDEEQPTGESVMKLVQGVIQGFNKVAGTTDDQAAEDGKSVESYRRWCCDQLLSFVRNPQMKKDLNWLTEVLRFFIGNALFKQQSAVSKLSGFESMPEPPVSDRTRTYAVQKLWVLLSELSSRRLENIDGQDNASLGMIKDDTHVLHYALTVYDQVKVSGKKESAFTPIADAFGSENKKLFKKASKMLVAFDKKNEIMKSKVAVTSMFCLFTLASTETESQDEIFGMLGDVVQAFSNIDSKKASSEEPKPADVLCDIFVSLLSDSESESPLKHTSKLVKHVVESAFKAISPMVSMEGLTSLLRVIDPVMHCLLNESEDDQEDALDGGNDEESDGELEAMAESESEDDSPVDEETIRKIKEAMGDAVQDEDLPDLTDEQMISMGFDEKLSQIFQERKMVQTDKLYLLRVYFEFRARILELLDGYMSKISAVSAAGDEVSYELIGKVAISLLRSANVYSNTASAVSSLEKNEALADFDKTELVTELSSIIELSTDQKNQIISKIIKLVKSGIGRIPVSKKANHEDINTLFEVVKEIQDMLTGSPSSASALANPSKEVVDVSAQAIAIFMKHILQIAAADKDLFKTTVDRVSAVLKSYLMLHFSKSGKGSIPSGVFIVLLDKMPVPSTSFVAHTSEIYWTILGKHLFEIASTGAIPDSETKLSKFNLSQLWHLTSAYTKKIEVPASSDFPDSSAISLIRSSILKTVSTFLEPSEKKYKSGKVKEILMEISALLKKYKKASREIFANPSELNELLNKLMADPEMAESASLKQIHANIVGVIGAANSKKVEKASKRKSEVLTEEKPKKKKSKK